MASSIEPSNLGGREGTLGLGLAWRRNRSRAWLLGVQVARLFMEDSDTSQVVFFGGHGWEGLGIIGTAMLDRSIETRVTAKRFENQLHKRPSPQFFPSSSVPAIGCAHLEGP